MEIINSTSLLPSRNSQMIARAAGGSVIRTLDEDEIYLLAQGCQREALTIMGQGKHMSGAEGQALEKELRTFLIESCSDLAAAEIQRAVRKGALGEYSTEERAYSVRAFSTWVRCYRQEKMKAMKELASRPTSEIGQIPERGQAMSKIEKVSFIESLYQRWKSAGTDNHLVGFVLAFEYAWTLQIFTFEATRGKRFRQEAIKSLTEKYEQMRLGNITRHVAASGLSALREIKEETPTTGLPDEVKTEAKRIACLEWFQELEMSGSSPTNEFKKL